jgi:hypothetical protein
MTIPDVPLPPWLRKIQQSWLWQFIGLPLSLGFGSAMLLDGCLANGIDHIQRACVMGAISTTVISFLTVVISGHSVNSASFYPNGKPNEMVAQVVAVGKATDAVNEAIATEEK